MDQINRNFPSSDCYSPDSFVGQFHEQHIWSDQEYLLLESAIYQLFDQHQNTDTLPKELVWKTTRLYSYLILSLGCHTDPKDSFGLKDLNYQELVQRRERLQCVFEGFFQGVMPDKDNFDYAPK